MTNVNWTPYLRLGCVEADAVYKFYENGSQVSRLASSFTENDTDFLEILALINEGKLVLKAKEIEEN